MTAKREAPAPVGDPVRGASVSVPEGNDAKRYNSSPGARSKQRRTVTVIDAIGASGVPLVEAVMDGDEPAGLVTLHPGRWGAPHVWRAETAATGIVSTHRSRRAAIAALPRRRR
jgi:hypothetical protein